MSFFDVRKILFRPQKVVFVSLVLSERIGPERQGILTNTAKQWDLSHITILMNPPQPDDILFLSGNRF